MQIWGQDVGIRVYTVMGSRRLDETIQRRIIAIAFSMAAEVEALLANESTQKFFAKRYNTTPGNFSIWVTTHTLFLTVDFFGNAGFP